MKRDALPFLLVIGLCVWIQHIFYSGYLIDDAYISLKYAKNIINGIGPVYQTGERVLGYTSPIWPFLVAAFSKALEISPLASIEILKKILYALLVICFFQLLKKIKDSPKAYIFAVIFALDAYILHYSSAGLETPLFLIFLAIFSYLYLFHKEKFIVTGAICGLLLLTRPEGVFPILLVLSDLLKERNIKGIVSTVLVTFLILMPWIAFSTYYYGSPIPVSVLSKMTFHTGWGGLIYAFYPVGMLFYKYSLALFLALISFKSEYLNDRLRKLVLVPLMMLFFFVLFRIPVYMWYYTPLVMFLLMYAYIGTFSRNFKNFSKVALVVLLLSQVSLTVRERYLLRGWPKVRDDFVEFSNCLNKYNYTVAIGDLLGVFGYNYTGKIVDYGGLVSRVYTYYPDKLFEMLQENEVDVFIYLASHLNPYINEILFTDAFNKTYLLLYNLHDHEIYVRRNPEIISNVLACLNQTSSR